jgi:hypothetical protein
LKLEPFSCYKTYLALKNHFTKDNYDYHKYCGKSKASLQSFYNRKDRFWFEKISRQKTDQEIIDFFVSNFVSCDDPQSLWIGEIIKEGEQNYFNWAKRSQALTYIFKEEITSVFTIKNFDQMFEIKNGQHPQILKQHLQKNLSIETLIILDRILSFKKNFDKKLDDPIWNFVSMKMTKYSSFLHIDIFKFRKILKESLL